MKCVSKILIGYIKQMELAMDEFRGNFEKPFRKLADTEISSVNIANEIADVVTKKLDGNVLPDMLKIITVEQSRRFIKKIFRKNSSDLLIVFHTGKPHMLKL